MSIIDEFKGQHRFLSNFWDEPFQYFSPWRAALVTARSSEHAFQSEKATSLKHFHFVLEADTASEAKKRGRAITMRPDWDEHCNVVMVNVLYQKFDKTPGLRYKLLSTGDAALIEGNTWHDNTWGNCTCGRDTCQPAGENRLGVILERVRAIMHTDLEAACGVTP